MGAEETLSRQVLGGAGDLEPEELSQELRMCSVISDIPWLYLSLAVAVGVGGRI